MFILSLILKSQLTIENRRIDKKKIGLEEIIVVGLELF